MGKGLNMNYPEHEKLKEVQDQSQVIGEFLEWLNYERKYSLCENEIRYDSWLPVSENHQELLAQYFNINLDKLEQEKRQMLESLK